MKIVIQSICPLSISEKNKLMKILSNLLFIFLISLYLSATCSGGQATITATNGNNCVVSFYVDGEHKDLNYNESYTWTFYLNFMEEKDIDCTAISGCLSNGKVYKKIKLSAGSNETFDVY